jgi:uncharacterized coiled-coil protein SlyX
MRERLEQRLQELKIEFDKGEQTLRELEEQAATVRQTLLRISGAIQVLEEELGDTDEPDGVVAGDREQKRLGANDRRSVPSPGDAAHRQPARPVRR